MIQCNMGADNTKIKKICKCGAKFMSLRWGNLGLCRPCIKSHILVLAKLRSQYGDKNGNWKGGRTKHSKGYILVLIPQHPRSHNGYVFEHIVVAEKKIGRVLLPNENVHHVNMVKYDNRPENLEVVDKGYHAHTHNGWKKPKVYKKKRIPSIKVELVKPKPNDRYTWPVDDVMLEMNSRMSTREISKEIGGVSNVAVWKRLRKILANT